MRDSGWRLDAPLPTPLPFDQPTTRWLYCSRVDRRETHTHLVKLLVDSAPAEHRSRLVREAHLAQLLEAPTPGWMCDLQLRWLQPALIYRRLSGHRLDAWCSRQPQIVSRHQWVAIALSLCECLLRLHRLGYAHCRLRPDHVWLTADDQVQLLGLGGCTAVGELRAGVASASAYDPPEMSASLFEVSSAVDIYAAAQLIDLLSHGQFVSTPIGECMRAVDGDDRPTSGELVELFKCYLHELQGTPSQFVPRAA